MIFGPAQPVSQRIRGRGQLLHKLPRDPRSDADNLPSTSGISSITLISVLS